MSSGLYDVFFAMHKTRNLQMQNDVEGLRPAFDKLDSNVKHIIEALKKAKFNSTDVENSVKKFISRWDVLKKKYVDLFKNCDKDLVVTIESNLPGFVEALKELFRVMTPVHLYHANIIKILFRSPVLNVIFPSMEYSEFQKFHQWSKEDFWSLASFYLLRRNRISL